MMSPDTITFSDGDFWKIRRANFSSVYSRKNHGFRLPFSNVLRSKSPTEDHDDVSFENDRSETQYRRRSTRERRVVQQRRAVLRGIFFFFISSFLFAVITHVYGSTTRVYARPCNLPSREKRDFNFIHAPHHNTSCQIIIHHVRWFQPVSLFRLGEDRKNCY